MQNTAAHLTILKHAVSVVDELEHYVLANINTTDAFLDTLVTEGFSLQRMIDFQQERVRQAQQVLTVLSSLPSVTSREAVNHVHE
ncbi:hypothetical protein GCM10008959_35310 [Deinococcus seoulensis]|uniref:Uncharacterized protein n=1 Tax=Deinococcus seoulensis TaxID=1837379 RepID=A0ABQ2RYS2_9DEIO|nr:hypothetical protein [Deinococcus seoulensis]GGR70521.1 hypothetical protein GCM10008959_35310 [Deinococcus seoulensis]